MYGSEKQIEDRVDALLGKLSCGTQYNVLTGLAPDLIDGSAQSRRCNDSKLTVISVDGSSCNQTGFVALPAVKSI